MIQSNRVENASNASMPLYMTQGIFGYMGHPRRQSVHCALRVIVGLLVDDKKVTSLQEASDENAGTSKSSH